MSHKRSWSRVQDHESFGNTFDAIFRKRPAVEFLNMAGEPETDPNKCGYLVINDRAALEDVLTDPESGFSKP